MYLPEKAELYNDEEEHSGDMMMLPQSQAQAQAQAILTESSGEDPEVRAPKKRAETWIHEETLALIGFRREMDRLFNTSKSNRHLWEQISSKMRDRGYDRSPTMCTDKWRNLLKEYKKLRHHDRAAGGGGVSSKLSCYKELGELLRDRTKNNSGGCGNNCKSPISAAKIDAFLHFPDKGLEDPTLTFGSIEDSSRSVLNVERGLEHAEHHTLAITAADAVAANGVPPWNWRGPVANGGASTASYGGRVISVKWGDYTRRIGIDGTADAIKEAIKSAFGLRTRRAFWLEDEDEVVRSLDRDMPLGIYTLHLDEGLTIKVCFYDDPDRMSVRTEDKILYTEEDLQEFLKRRGWAGLRELSGFRIVDTLDELRQGAVYQGVRHLGDP